MSIDGERLAPGPAGGDLAAEHLPPCVQKDVPAATNGRQAAPATPECSEAAAHSEPAESQVPIVHPDSLASKAQGAYVPRHASHGDHGHRGPRKPLINHRWRGNKKRADTFVSAAGGDDANEVVSQEAAASHRMDKSPNLRPNRIRNVMLAAGTLAVSAVVWRYAGGEAALHAFANIFVHTSGHESLPDASGAQHIAGSMNHLIAGTKSASLSHKFAQPKTETVQLPAGGNVGTVVEQYFPDLSRTKFQKMVDWVLRASHVKPYQINDLWPGTPLQLPID